MMPRVQDVYRHVAAFIVMADQLDGDDHPRVAEGKGRRLDVVEHADDARLTAIVLIRAVTDEDVSDLCHWQLLLLLGAAPQTPGKR